MAILAAPAAYSEVASTVTESEPGTLLGNYLSGRVARGDHDTAAAADFYSRALAEDPNNELILEQAFLLETAAADWDSAIKLARELVKVEPSHRIAQFLLGCEAFKKGDYKEADEHFAAARQGPIADLTSILARAWVQQAAGKTDQALATLDSLSDADWAQFYQRYHRALIADVAGKREIGAHRLRASLQEEPGDPQGGRRLCASRAERQQPQARQADAEDPYRQIGAASSVEALMAEIDSGKTPPLLVTSPTDGLAEVFYGIGDALAGEGGLDMGIIFLQFALYLEPNFPLAQVALAEAYDSAKRYDLELTALDNIPQEFAALAERPDPEGASR